MKTIVPIALAAALLGTSALVLADGAALPAGQSLTSFAQQAASADTVQGAVPQGAPGFGATAPWLAGWDPFGKVGAQVVLAKASAQDELVLDTATANGALSLGSTGASGVAGDEAADALAAAHVAAQGASGVAGDAVQGLYLPAGALPASASVAAPGVVLPTADLARPTAVLAQAQPPTLPAQGVLPSADALRATRDAGVAWAGDVQGLALSHAGDAEADAQGFGNHAYAAVGADAASLGATATGLAGVVGDAVLPGPAPVPQVPEVPELPALPVDPASLLPL
jgi:hypothetical protein